MKPLAIILSLLLSCQPSVWAGRTFNGSSDSAAVPTVGTVADLLGQTKVTFSGWVKFSSVPSSEAEPWGAGSNLNGTEIYYLSVSSSGHTNDFGCHWRGSTSLNHNLDIYAGITIAANTWYNVVCSYNDSNVGVNPNQAFLYVSGTQKVSIGVSNGTISNPGNDPNWCFGGYAATGIGGACGSHINFAGTVAEVAMWADTLSTGQMASLGTVCPSRIPFGPSGGARVAYWHLYGASGTSPEPDASGNVLNATLTGTTAANHAPCIP